MFKVFLFSFMFFFGSPSLATEDLGKSYSRYQYTCNAKYSFNRWKSFNYIVKAQVNIFQNGNFDFHRRPNLTVYRQNFSNRRTFFRNSAVRYDGFRDSLHWFSHPQSTYGLNFAFNPRRGRVSFNHKIERYGNFLRSHGSCKRKLLGRY